MDSFEAQMLESISVEGKKEIINHLTIDKTHRKLFDNTLIFSEVKKGQI